VKRLLLSAFVMAATLLLATGSAFARPTAALGTAMNYELDTAGRNYQPRVPFSVRGGYNMRLFDLYAEYSYFNDVPTGTSMVQVGTQNHEFLIWGRKGLLLANTFNLFGAAGAGVHRQVVKTTFDNESYRDQGQLEAVLGAAGGVQIRLHRHFDLTFEARLTSAQSYTPNPLFGLGAFLGVIF
jgi:hypothetical protein